MIYLSNFEAEKILKYVLSGKESVEVSPDLGLSGLNCPINGDEIEIDGITIGVGALKTMASFHERIFVLDENEAELLDEGEGGYFKLTPTKWGIPTIQISGIKMHRSQDIDPWQDTINKTRGIVKKGDMVLDTCTGLGYTAIRSIELGARLVISIEYSMEVHKLCRKNPWSKRFFESDRIFKMIANSARQVELFQDRSFDSIIHDPPRFSIAGDLYSDNFYNNLNRILKNGGRLFHYIGKPDSKFGRRVFKSVIIRLEKAGLSAEVSGERYGIIARKVRKKI